MVQVWDISISKDGSFLASGSLDGTIKVWKLPQNYLSNNYNDDSPPTDPELLPVLIKTLSPRSDDCAESRHSLMHDEACKQITLLAMF